MTPQAGDADDGESKIVRATTRFQIDLWALSARENKARAPGEKRVLSDAEKMMRNALEEVSILAATARNVGMRQNVRKDSDALDAYLGAHGQMPKKSSEWTSKLYSYPTMRAACPKLSSNIVATLQRDIDRKWSGVRYDVLVRQSESHPHYRAGQPFPIPAQALRIRAREDGALVLSFALFSSEHDGVRKVEIPMIPRDEHQREALGKIASGEWKNGQATIERDRLRPSRWYVRLAYTRKVPKRKEGIVASVHKGMRTFLCATTEAGEHWLYEGTDIVSFLKQVQRRRQEYQRQVKASARTGHGRRRVLTPIAHLQERAERWRQTRCQVIARRAARWLAERNVRLVYVEDMTGIRDSVPEALEGGKYIWQLVQEWPYYQLQTRLISCLEEYGIETVLRPSAFISQRCPKCGAIDPEHTDLRTWKLRCKSCSFVRHLDVAAGMNNIASGEAARRGEETDFTKKQAELEGRKKKGPRKRG